MNNFNSGELNQKINMVTTAALRTGQFVTFDEETMRCWRVKKYFGISKNDIDISHQ